jgi:hypothetical protein
MSKRNDEPVDPLAHWPTECVLPNGSVIVPGDEITIEGEGRYRLNAIRPNGELNCWGKITSNGIIKAGSMRSFMPSQVKTVHVKKRMQDTLRAGDSL